MMKQIAVISTFVAVCFGLFLPETDVESLTKVMTDSVSKRGLKSLPPLSSWPKPHERTLKPGEIPAFVIDYAPMVYLYSEERYMPYNIEEFVTHFHAELENGTRLDQFGDSLKITDLEALQQFQSHENPVYFMSNEDFDTDPEWITGRKNRPNFYTGELKNVPATLIVVDKGNGWVDAYWFYFYSFNEGPYVMGTGPFGDHVGDWEHSLVRFYNGEPVIVWMSAHGGGGAYFYTNLEKLDTHPVIFAARGTHANYASTGQHSHDLPYSILSDFTDRGPLWNPSLNFLGYTYDGTSVTFANGSHAGREQKFGNWLKFVGYWGDKKLPPDDPRQRWSPFEWKYIGGPCGPMCKNLLRISPCQRAKWWNFWNGCNIRRYIKYGDGLFDSEGNNSCGNLYNKIRPKLLQRVVKTFTLGGYFCWIMDVVYG
ncbi:hypothetical protein OGAPHI_006463 [Ogataea philodendri]|uniref:Vacuolar protein sorting-associated protein 62 n=1 Tax=Ogataea philodendri TaxID=1378263 RepID=A0A9P8NY24_9ASCO|nr:uncharacterized protein OGAPHI_006463 [Ogataea philodendri]KAH3661615.1 hypothetical protein OGAPHI_006463 [Ogataea philodendri]